MIFKRIFDVNLIPVYLVEQVPDMDVNNFYHALGSLDKMPNHLVEVVQDEGLIILGFTWVIFNPMSLDLHVNTVSLDKKLQGDGIILKEYIEHLRSLVKDTEINKVTWATDRPAFYERMGFKRSKQIFLEYDLGNEVQDGQDKAGN